MLEDRAPGLVLLTMQPGAGRALTLGLGLSSGRAKGRAKGVALPDGGEVAWFTGPQEAHACGACLQGCCSWAPPPPACTTIILTLGVPGGASEGPWGLVAG